MTHDRLANEQVPKVRPLFWAGNYDGTGYPVKRGMVPVAVFVTESEARDYAAYRNEMLAKHGTTDETLYR